MAAPFPPTVRPFTAEITSSYSLKGGLNWVEWFGTRGAALVGYWNPGQPDLQYKVNRGDWTAIACPKHPDRVEGEIAHFLDSVRTRRKPVLTVDDGLKTSRIIAAATGKRIRIRL